MLFLALAMNAYPSGAFAATEPNANPSSPGFKITVCDGPDISGVDPSKLPDYKKTADGHDYVPCNFSGLMLQARHLINIMLFVGVLVAIAGLFYGGILYISGVQKNIDKAKEIFPKLFIGFIIMLTSWFVVFQVLSWLTENNAYKSLLGS